MSKPDICGASLVFPELSIFRHLYGLSMQSTDIHCTYLGLLCHPLEPTSFFAACLPGIEMMPGCLAHFKMRYIMDKLVVLVIVPHKVIIGIIDTPMIRLL